MDSMSPDGYVFSADTMVDEPMSTPYGSRELSQSVPSLNPSFPLAQHPNHQNRTVIGNPLYPSTIPVPSLSAQTALLHHQQHTDPYKTPPANASPPFYFADMPSTSSTSSTPTAEYPTLSSRIPFSSLHNNQQSPSNPGSLSFEDLLSIYYPDQPPAQQQQYNRQQRGSSPLSTATQQSDSYDSTGLPNLQAMHLSSSGNIPPLPSPSADEELDVAAAGSHDNKLTDVAAPERINTSATNTSSSENSSSIAKTRNNNNSKPSSVSMLHQQKMSQNKTKCTNCGTTTT